MNIFRRIGRVFSLLEWWLEYKWDDYQCGWNSHRPICETPREAIERLKKENAESEASFRALESEIEGGE